MVNITIKDLAANKDLDKKDLSYISGGFNPQPDPPISSIISNANRKRLDPNRRKKLKSISRNRLNTKSPINTKGWAIVEST